MYKRILVPLDGGATSERGLREAIQLAAEHGATLRLLHVQDNFPMLLELSPADSFEKSVERMRHDGVALLARARRTAEAAGVSCEVVLREVARITIADAIVEEAAHAGCDLIVMGTHGRHGAQRLAMGSEAELVARTSAVPVLLLRQEEVAA